MPWHPGNTGRAVTATKTPALWSTHNSHRYQKLHRHYRGTSSQSEMDPKSHTTIIVLKGKREPAYLYGGFSSSYLRCPHQWETWLNMLNQVGLKPPSAQELLETYLKF
ncbi:hypothetical protein AVEN_148985-1 [Araneus ventricosus]|uniref:Uncharacterized protein n=1 Tax=Araneus ventricosus TaxID=182803 RepID=A0A4Y2UQ38_ARAVE|nr:hypothetical protein AVEN_255493-1 [Araneus ventricosus]GBO15226.1 hypothetical protein AVEN_148985-1 [Araneus ventricosus]